MTSTMGLVSVIAKDEIRRKLLLQRISDNPWRSLVNNIAGDDWDQAGMVGRLLKTHMIRIVNPETRTMILTNIKAAFTHTNVNLIKKFVCLRLCLHFCGSIPGRMCPTLYEDCNEQVSNIPLLRIRGTT